MTKKKTKPAKTGLKDLLRKDPKPTAPEKTKKTVTSLSESDGKPGPVGPADPLAADRLKNKQPAPIVRPGPGPVSPSAALAGDPDPFYMFVFKGLSKFASKFSARWEMDPDEIKDFALSLDAIMQKYFPAVVEKAPEFAFSETLGRYVGARFRYKKSNGKPEPKPAPGPAPKKKDPGPKAGPVDLEKLEAEAKRRAENSGSEA